MKKICKQGDNTTPYFFSFDMIRWAYYHLRNNWTGSGMMVVKRGGHLFIEMNVIWFMKKLLQMVH